MSVGAICDNVNDPLVKAVDILWDEGLVVVAAAGNNGPQAGSITSPGISKKIITVGAYNDNKNVDIHGNNLVNFSGRGPTAECVIKPNILAPGANIISCASVPKEKSYRALSGTSMATPMVSGACALLLQQHPHLLPNQIKQRLKTSATCLGLSPNQQGWGILNIAKFVAQT